MPVFNDACTLYNIRRDSEGQAYYRTALRGVAWYKVSKTAMDGAGIQSASTVAVNIPVEADTEGKPYRPSAAWEESCWTMQDGDLLVRGECLFEFGAGMSEKDLREFAGYGNVFAVYYWNDSLKGSPAVRHYRMEAK